MMVKPVAIKALENYKIWIKYTDGVEGEVDLSGLVGRGVFKIWNNYSEFKKVQIGSHGAIAWGEEVDLCPDAIYLKLTNIQPEDLFPSLSSEKIDA
jgi:hypothetical protein